jgi:dephospho-CoA kinase
MIVIGVVGKIGSGKDELAKTLNRYFDVPILSSGDIAGELVQEQGIEKSRENLHEIFKQVFEQYGQDFFAKQIINKIETGDWQSVCVTDVRTPDDAELLSKHFGENFMLIHVNVDDKVLRYQRLKKRNRPRDVRSFSEFLIREQVEMHLFQLGETLVKADLVVNNNGTLYDFQRAVQRSLINNGLTQKLNCNWCQDE